MFTLFFFFIGGYGAGWVVRHLVSHIRHSMGTCNIGKRGISWRTWLAMALVIIGFYFELPIVTFFAGFTWYESRAKWCIAQSLIRQ